MKNIYLLTILISLFISCEEDILDRESIDIISQDKVWNSPELTERQLIQSYIQTTVFVNETATPSHISNLHFMPFLVNSVSDESRFFRNWSGCAQCFKMSGIQSGGGLLEWWEESYEVIRNLNIFIEEAPNSVLDDQTISTRLAEARFLRAYNYFSMVKRYGGVPIVTRVIDKSSAEEDIYPTRNTEQEVYDFVISEIDEIVDDLPAQVNGNEYGRATKYAALALQSRAALYAGSIAQFGEMQLNNLLGIPNGSKNIYYQKSIDASEKIINSGLFSLYNKYPDDKALNYRQIFLDERNVETIFAKQHDATSASEGGNGWEYDFFQCPKPNGWGGGTQNEVYLEMVEEYDYIDGSSGKWDRDYVQSRLWTVDELYANKDPRFFATFFTHETPWKGGKIDYHRGVLKPDGSVSNSDYAGYRGIGPQARYTGFGVLKYLDENKDNLQEPYSSQQDWIVFRYAETLLNLAEASFETGNTTKALQLVNQIRERAGIEPLTTITREAIRKERKVELSFEGHRYWDVRRWRIAEEVLTKPGSGIHYIIDPETEKLKIAIREDIDSYRGGTTPVFFPHNYYFPITNKRVNTNPNLLENPGYN